MGCKKGFSGKKEPERRWKEDGRKRGIHSEFNFFFKCHLQHFLLFCHKLYFLGNRDSSFFFLFHQNCRSHSRFCCFRDTNGDARKESQVMAPAVTASCLGNITGVKECKTFDRENAWIQKRKVDGLSTAVLSSILHLRVV